MTALAEPVSDRLCRLVLERGGTLHGEIEARRRTLAINEALFFIAAVADRYRWAFGLGYAERHGAITFHVSASGQDGGARAVSAWVKIEKVSTILIRSLEHYVTHGLPPAPKRRK